MKLRDILMEQQERGTYAGVKFSPDTVARIKAYIKDNNIPNPLRSEKFHTTLVYSRKYIPEYEPAGKYPEPMIGTPVRLDVWKTKPTDGSEPSNCLVMEYDCPELTARHEELMAEHGATHDYPEYRTHVSLSYSIGDLDYKTLPDIIEGIGPIEIVEEYGEDLDLNWAVNKGTTNTRSGNDRRAA